MSKNEAPDWLRTAGLILKKIGGMLLKVCAFFLWILLSIVNIVFREAEKKLKEWIFGKKEF